MTPAAGCLHHFDHLDLPPGLHHRWADLLPAAGERTDTLVSFMEELGSSGQPVRDCWRSPLRDPALISGSEPALENPELVWETVDKLARLEVYSQVELEALQVALKQQDLYPPTDWAGY
jgi:hypothetical protein